jgi:nitroreductase
VAAIPLNWYADEKSHQQIHELLNIPASQEVVAFIACGNPKEEFNLVTSKRRNANEIVTYF